MSPRVRRSARVSIVRSRWAFSSARSAVLADVPDLGQVTPCGGELDRVRVRDSEAGSTAEDRRDLDHVQQVEEAHLLPQELATRALNDAERVAPFLQPAESVDHTVGVRAGDVSVKNWPST